MGEAVRLVRVLRSDPANMVCAAVEGWAYPFSREAMILADLFDLEHQIAAKKRPDPYPRPWSEASKRKQMRPNAAVSQADVLAALTRAGH